MSYEILLINSGDQALLPINWSDLLGSGGLTLASVVHTVPSPLTKLSEAATSTQSQVKVSGAVHGQVYLIQATATLSNGEIIKRPVTARGWDS